VYFAKAAAVYAAGMAAAWRYRRGRHPYPQFGPANWITAIRALLVSLVAGLIGEAPSSSVAAAAIVFGGAATILDGVDGWLARRTGMASEFGARFDMEVDSALILALAVLAWEHDKAGAWVLAAGLLRYAFVAAGFVLPWLRAPLAGSWRGKAVCVLQIAALLIAVAPPVPRIVAEPLLAVALAALAYSFAVDIAALYLRSRGSTAPPSTVPAGLLALVVLNASLTFQNVWPTPAVAWNSAFSVELAIVMLALAVLAVRTGRVPRALTRTLAICWVLLIVGRYEYVTAAALFGRELNLYFDLRFLPAVTALLAQAAPTWMVVSVAAALVSAVALLYGAAAWALARASALLVTPQARRAVAIAASVIVLLYGAGEILGGSRLQGWFTNPVTGVYARQVVAVADGLRRGRAVPPSPSIESSFSRVNGADVFLFFVESYGAVTYQRADLAARLGPARDAFARAVHETNRDVVTAFVESPTFGGNSWLAHITLLSGIEVRDLDTNKLLMMQPRDTLVKAFDRHGYRTVAVMPGQKTLWPEGSFYGFNDIYGVDRLDYRGPAFGWFAIPDQFSLAKLDELDVNRRPRRPLFVFFPTLSPHTPFEPLPPYEPDWTRMTTDQPYSAADAERALARQPNWLNLSASYGDSMAYEFETFAGYLRRHAADDFVMILIGDHEPPAVVSGPGVSWDVPVHVVASRREVLDRLIAHGFYKGIDMRRPALGKMHTLLPMLLDAFGGDAP